MSIDATRALVVAVADGDGMRRRQRAKRIVEMDRLAAMRGGPAGSGRLLRIGGQAMSSSNLDEVLVGPPSALLER